MQPLLPLKFSSIYPAEQHAQLEQNFGLCSLLKGLRALPLTAHLAQRKEVLAKRWLDCFEGTELD